MGTQTLPHCNPTPMSQLPDAAVRFDAGSMGDGMVEVTVTKPGGTETHNVNCGQTSELDLKDATEVIMHFNQAPTGPEAVVATWSPIN